MRTRFVLAAAGLAVLLTGCETADERQVIGVDATGTALGLVFIDRDGDGVPGSLDMVASNVHVTLTRDGALRPTASALTDARGVYRIPAVPVGSYRLGIDSTTLGDSLQLVRADSARVIVAAYDSAASVLALGIRPVELAALRAEPAGKLLSVVAVALSGSGTYGDTTLHIADGTGALRVTQMLTGGLAAGDSIRLLGRTGTRNGQVVLMSGAVYRLGKGTVPEPLTLSTQLAARADSGKRDAALVRVTGTLIQADVSTADKRLTINDGSGPVEVFLDRYARIAIDAPLVPGVSIEATGVLAPLADGSGRWRLKPRRTDDFKVLIPETTVDAVRQQSPGVAVSFTGVALNGWAEFGDSTVHVADPTGAIRAIRVAAVFLLAGDSVRVTGTTGTVGGQPTLLGATMGVLGTAQAPPPASISTKVAASANSGRLDAALVKVHGAVRDSSLVTASGVNFTIDDGSGVLSIFVDRRTGIGQGPWRTGTEISITGVLVPRADGRSWFLKPRTRDDIVR